MDDEEYLELAGLIRDELVELGLYDIADFSHYADAEEEDRGPPDGRLLIWGMLTAFDRYLASNAGETVSASLALIGESIDEGEPPRAVVVHGGEEEAAVRGRRETAEAVATLGEMSETRSALLRLRKLLLEGYEPPESEGERRESE